MPSFFDQHKVPRGVLVYLIWDGLWTKLCQAAVVMNGCAGEVHQVPL